MRNWNSQWWWFSPEDIPSFQTTYEELKLLLVSFSRSRSLSLPDYLWGIETSIRRRDERESYWLPDYLWGIETLLMPMTAGSFREPASRLPMRNWNYVLYWVSDHHAYRASRLPMRNWNSWFPSVSWSRSLASRLPMRNWNYVLYWVSDHHAYASRLPMRNWNLTQNRNGRRGKDRLRFQTTYEELKLVHLQLGRPAVNCFQTTYEELKPFSSSNPFSFPWKLPDYLWGIETFAWKLIRKPGCASRLPMRNWNRDRW